MEEKKSLVPGHIFKQISEILRTSTKKRLGMEFDMKSGRTVLPFSLQGGIRGQRIDAVHTSFIPVLARMNYANSRRFRFNGRERSEILDHLLRYYGCHFPGCDRLKSLEGLRELFG